MADLGRGLIFLAFAVAVYGVVSAIYGGVTGRREWVTSARRSVYTLAGLTTAAFAVLELAFLRNDFSFSVVQSHSSITTPTSRSGIRRPSGPSGAPSTSASRDSRRTRAGRSAAGRG